MYEKSCPNDKYLCPFDELTVLDRLVTVHQSLKVALKEYMSRLHQVVWKIGHIRPRQGKVFLPANQHLLQVAECEEQNILTEIEVCHV